MSGLLERLLAAINVPPELAAHLRTVGLPRARTESWRYSSLKPLEKLQFADAASPTLSAAQPVRLAIPISSRGEPGELRDGGKLVGATTSPAALQTYPASDGCESSFAQLAASADGARGQITAARYLALGASTDQQFWQSANTLEVPAGTRGELLLHHVDLGGRATLGNVLTRIRVAPGAELTLIRVQEGNPSAYLIERSEIELGEGARLRVLLVDLGSLWYRHELAIDLGGEQAQAEVYGLSALQGRQHGDTQLSFAHRFGKGRSQTRYKSVADGRSRCVFNGRIAVAPGADGTDAELHTGNLLLSAFAEIDTKPELEIYADEVRCKHGATVGQLDERSLFYLRSRGISAEQARQMLTFAFCREILDALGDPPLAEDLATRLSQHLPNVAEAES